MTNKSKRMFFYVYDEIVEYDDVNLMIDHDEMMMVMLLMVMIVMMVKGNE